MNGNPHRAVAAATGMAIAHHAGHGPWLTIGSGLIATALAAGITSPDVDQAWPEQHHGPLKHRGITHSWILPALAWWLFQPTTSSLAGLLIAGWCSHLAADFVFGHAYWHRGRKVRGPGIPLAPWWWHIGVGLPSSGPAATITAALTLAASTLWSLT